MSTSQPTDFPPPPPASRPAFPRRVWSWYTTRRLWLKILIPALLVIVIASAAAAGGTGGSQNASSTPTTVASGPTATTGPTNTPAPTATATRTPQWTTIQSFKGNGNKKTAIFTVPTDWRLLWTCDPNSFGGSQYNLIVDVYSDNGNILFPTAINTLCAPNNTTDNTEEHSGGNVYLDVTSEAAWTIAVQAFE